jgi:hypothetical protein
MLQKNSSLLEFFCSISFIRDHGWTNYKPFYERFEEIGNVESFVKKKNGILVLV